MRNQLKMMLALLIFTGALFSQTHPRLFYGPADVSTLQSRATTQGTPAYELWQLIKTKQADWYKDSTRWSELNDGYVMENALAVALAYTITENSEYLYKAKAIIFGNVSGWGGLVNDTTSDVYFRITRIGTLATVADVIWNQLTQAERIQIGQQINSDVVTYLRPTIFQSWYHINNNHLAREGSALAFAAITFHDLLNEGGQPVYPQALNDLDSMRKLIVTNLNGNKNIIERLYDTEGGQVEGVEYSMVGLSRILPILEALKRFDGVDYFASTEIQKRLSKMPNWYSYEIQPAPRDNKMFFNNINDSDLGSNPWWDNANGIITTMLGLGGYYQTPTTRWAFENSVQTIPNLQTSTAPGWHRYSKTQAHLISLLKYNQQTLVSPSTVLPKSKFFPERGLVYVRSSNTWADNNDIQFALEGAPCINPANNTFSVKHDQADKNHFTLFAFGVRFIRDYGRGAAFGGKRPETHNYIMIDNKGQAIKTYIDPDDSLEKDDWNPRPGKIVSHVFNGTYTFVHGDAKDAFGMVYGHDTNGNPQQITQLSGSPNSYVNPVQKADRFVMFNQAEGTVPAYVVITDDINKNDQTHNYELLLHSDFSASGTNPVILGDSTGTHLRVWQTSSSVASLVSETFSMPTEGDGVLDNLGTNAPATASYKHSMTINSVVNPYYHTVLYPSKTGMAQPTVSYPSTSGGSAVKLVWSGYEDYSLFRYSSGNVSASGFTTDAKLLQIRKTSAGVVTSFAFGYGTSLTNNGTLLAETFGVNSKVMLTGTEVTIEGTNVSDFRVYAPNATSVKVNGIAVNFVQAGNYVEPTILSHSRTWSGFVKINSNVTLVSGNTLTISPGVVVQFASGTNLTLNGILNAQGTSSQRITFTSQSGNTPGSWGSIILNGSGASGSTLNYVVARYGTEIRANSVPIFVVNYSTIENMVNGVNAYSSNGWVMNSTITTPRDHSIISNGSTIACYHNTISKTNLSGAGILYSAGGGDYIWNNDISGFNWGVGAIWGARADCGHPSNTGNNNSITNCLIGAKVYQSGFAMFGQLVDYPNIYDSYYTGNTINDNLSLDVEVYTNSTVYAEGTNWGGGSPAYSVYNNSYFYYDLGGNNSVLAQNLLQNSKQDIVAEAALIGNKKLQQNTISPNTQSSSSGVTKDALGILHYIKLMKTYNDTTAEAILNTFLSLPETAPQAAKLFLTNIYLKRGESEKAKQVNKALSKANPNSALGSRAQLNNFYIALYNEKNYSLASVLLDKIAANAKYIEPIELALAQHDLETSQAVNQSVENSFVKKQSQQIIAIHPQKFELSQNYPNPFNPSTTIAYSLPQAGNVTLKIYDALGREVATLVNDFKSEGEYRVQFNGSSLSSGMYFYRLQAGSFVETKKLVLMK